MPLNENAYASSIHGVIDIGSNSVRLVIYRIVDGAFFPIHNEKVLAALGEGVSETKMLSQKGVELSLQAIRRFKLLLDAWQIKNYDAIATAAVRYANDGQDFINKIEEQTNLKVRLISGEDEGRLSALGVKFGSVNAKGFMGDLGGSSLELVSLENRPNLKKESWPLGPLAMGEFVGAKNLFKNIDSVKTRIEKILDASNVINSAKQSEFHAVGGAWRAFANIHMVVRNYPIHILHNYSVNAQDALEVASFISSQSRKSIEKIAGVSSRRAETLPYAALLLKSIIEKSQIQKVVFSSYGLREGVLAERFEFNDLSENPIIASALAIGVKSKIERIFSDNLYIWLKNLIEFASVKLNLLEEKAFLKAATYLANIGSDYHPDHRAKLAYDTVLQAPYPSASHEDRLKMARIIAKRYGAKDDEMMAYCNDRSIAPHNLEFANIIGLGMRLASAISANEGHLLAKTNLVIVGDKITLKIANKDMDLMSPSVEKRLNALADLISKKVEVLNL